jgi:hypothetical protein
MLYDSDERATLMQLDGLLSDVRKARWIGSAVRRVSAKLAADPAAVLAWEPVPLDRFRGAVPGDVRSCWVFVARARRLTRAERHPNSVQRMASLRGEGDLDVWRDGEWRPHPLVSDPGAPLERRWISVPVNVWHQAVVPHDKNWAVLSFHTAAEADLIEERGDPERPRTLWRRKYVD